MPAEKRGRRTTGRRTRQGEVTLRRKDSLSMQKNVVNTTRASSSTWGRTASSFPDTSRHCESEKKKRVVMEMSPLKSLHLSTQSFSLSRIIILPLPSHTPTYTDRPGLALLPKRVSAAAGGRQGLWLRQRRRVRRIYVAATLHGHYRLYSPPFVWVSKSEYDTLDRLYTQKEGGGREGGTEKVLGVFYVFVPASSS